MAAKAYYSDVDTARKLAALRPGDLIGLDTAAALDDQIEEWLKDIKDMIDEFLRRDFAKEEDVSGKKIPRGIHMAAARALRNVGMMARMANNAGQATPDEFNTLAKRDTDQILSDTIKADLSMYRALRDDTTSNIVRLRVMPGRAAVGYENPYYPDTEY